MPEVIVRYKNRKTLEALHDLAKYFGYSISKPVSRETKQKHGSVNGVTIIPADNSVNTSDLTDVFTGKNIDPEQLRTDAWQKKKVICDTDVMIDYWDQSNSRHVATKSELENFIELDNLLLSAVTKMELILGATNKADMQKITKRITRFNVALINNDITLKAFDLLEKYRLSHRLSLLDSIIVATALITDLSLFTYNTKHYQFISRLKLYMK